MSLRIRNRTRWRSDQLRAIAVRVRDSEFAPDEFRKRKLVMTFTPATKRYSGHASIKGNYSTIRLPNPRVGFSVDKAALACLIAHELAHNAGMRNERIMRSRSTAFGWKEGFRQRYAWADAMPLEPAPVIVATPTERAEARLDTARARLARWESIARRAANGIRKWRRRIASMEARQAARKGGRQ